MKREHRLPRWMKAQMPNGKKYTEVFKLIGDNGLNTICTSGNCPNKGECWNAGTASFMILGSVCTRNCRFCDVSNGKPEKVDAGEPQRLAEAIKTLKLSHAVITSVTRDDLPDGGAAIWAEVVRTVKQVNQGITIETLIPDFKGNYSDIKKVIDSKPNVISHNLETVKRLTPKVRSVAEYDRSISVLKQVSESGAVAKSGIMLGLGETDDEVFETLHDFKNVGVKVVTIGQYLQPNLSLYPVKEYITPEKFSFFKEQGEKIGFSFVESSPLVRSSYHAEKHVCS